MHSLDPQINDLMADCKLKMDAATLETLPEAFTITILPPNHPLIPLPTPPQDQLWLKDSLLNLKGMVQGYKEAFRATRIQVPNFAQLRLAKKEIRDYGPMTTDLNQLKKVLHVLLFLFLFLFLFYETPPSLHTHSPHMAYNTRS